MRSITAGFFSISLDEIPDPAGDPRASALIGDRGASTLPSTLGAPSLLDRLSTDILSPAVSPSRLLVADMFRIGGISDGLPALRLTAVRIGGSSTRLVTPLAMSLSLKALTVTGATDGVTTVGTADIAIFGRFEPLEADDLVLPMPDMDVLDDCSI
jgi:hypothetical protein